MTIMHMCSENPFSLLVICNGNDNGSKIYLISSSSFYKGIKSIPSSCVKLVIKTI